MVLPAPPGPACRRLPLSHYVRMKKDAVRPPGVAVEAHLEYGAPGETRTPDLQIRSLPLYPTELQALTFRIYQLTRSPASPASKLGKLGKVNNCVPLLSAVIVPSEELKPEICPATHKQPLYTLRALAGIVCRMIRLSSS